MKAITKLPIRMFLPMATMTSLLLASQLTLAKPPIQPQIVSGTTSDSRTKKPQISKSQSGSPKERVNPQNLFEDKASNRPPGAPKSVSKDLNDLLENDGNSNGGGGGGIKMPNGKIYTLAQAGLKFPDASEAPFYPEFEVLKMAKDTLKSLEAYCSPNFDSGCKGTLQALSEEITANDHIYKRAMVVDKKLFDRMKQEYQQFVAKLPVKGKFVLPAYTDLKKTNLFPDYFDADLTTKSLYMIHEAVFSLHPKNLIKLPLEKVLILDVAILDVQAEANPVTVRAFRDAVTAIAESSRSFSGALEVQLAGNYLEYLADLGIAVSFDQLLPEKIHSESIGAVYEQACLSANKSSDKGDYYRNFKYTFLTLAGQVEVDAYRLSQHRSVEADFFKVFFHQALAFNCPRTYEEVYNLKKQFPDFISDLEFRGVRVFNKSTQKEIIGLTYFEEMGFYPLKTPSH